jgi:hypothetical protein
LVRRQREARNLVPAQEPDYFCRGTEQNSAERAQFVARSLAKIGDGEARRYFPTEIAMQVMTGSVSMTSARA